jgi:hypothetical protein
MYDRRMNARWVWLAAAACGGRSSGPDIGGSVLEMHGSPSRAGAYVAPNLTHAAAAGMHVDPTFSASATYNGLAYAQALYVDLGGAAKDRLVTATEQNEVTAFDATGAMVWQKDLGTPQPMPNAAEGANCGNINPLGITGTPVIDYASRTIYLDAMIRDTAAHHRVFALSLDDGSTLPSWPVDLGTLAYNGIPFTPATQNQRGGITLLGGRVLVPYGGHAGDCGDYHGWLVSVPTNDPQHPTAFATKDRFSGAWMPAGVSSDGQNAYIVFGNGEGNATWGNSEMVGRLDANATFSGDSHDFWVHPDWQNLDATDLDMTGPALPVDVAGATPSKLIVSFGKNGHVYLLDRDNMGGLAVAPLADLQASQVEIINASATYRTKQGTYVVFRGRGVTGCPGLTGGSSLVSVRIVPGAPPTMQLAWCAGSAQSGSPIATTTDGTSEPIVWAVGAESDQRLHGYDGDTGAVIFNGGGAFDAMASTSRFITPIVAKGRIFVAADGRLYAFAAN